MSIMCEVILINNNSVSMKTKERKGAYELQCSNGVE
jgi:hypothetical protein